MPTLHVSGGRYFECCGKVICSGCIHAPLYDDQGNEVDNKKCPFCRTLFPSSREEINQRYKKRMDAGDAIAIHDTGCWYKDGEYGFPQDHTKALELWHRAAELGYAGAYCSIGYAYYNGNGVEVDKKRAKHYLELAAMKGDSIARNNLGNMERREYNNQERALKHYIVAVRGGHSDSLNEIKWLYSNGYATKEDYTKALKSYQAYLGEIKSVQRNKAAAAKEKYRYY